MLYQTISSNLLIHTFQKKKDTCFDNHVSKPVSMYIPVVSIAKTQQWCSIYNSSDKIDCIGISSPAVVLVGGYTADGIEKVVVISNIRQACRINLSYFFFLKNTNHSAPRHMGIAARISTTECCLTKATEIQITPHQIVMAVLTHAGTVFSLSHVEAICFCHCNGRSMAGESCKAAFDRNCSCHDPQCTHEFH